MAGQPPARAMTAVAVEPVAGVAALRDEWAALEVRAGASPYLGWEWLRAWEETYDPVELAVVRVGAPGGAADALGLLERDGRRWGFAGGAVTPVRGLLTAPDDAPGAWAALRQELVARSDRWSSLAFAGAPPAAAALPRARVSEEPVWVLGLPASFEDYLARRSATRRKTLRRTLRRVEEGGGRVRCCAGSEAEGAIGAFVALHGLRAASVGQRHPQVDERLAAMLERVAGAARIALRLFVLEIDGEPAAVNVRVDRDDQRRAVAYNGGMHPAHAAASPGIALELACVRDAIERGHTRYELGPGELAYKRALGAEPEEAWSGTAFAPTPRGALVRAGAGAAQGVYAALPGRRLLGGLRRRRALSRAASSSGPSTAG